MDQESLGRKFEKVGFGFLRWGLVVAVGWIAAMKGTEYEAIGIQPLIAHSPLLNWMYSVWSVHHATEVIGSLEGVIIILIALRRWSPRVCRGQRRGRINVSYDAFIHVLNARLGADPGRLSRALGRRG